MTCEFEILWIDLDKKRIENRTVFDESDGTVARMMFNKESTYLYLVTWLSFIIVYEVKSFQRVQRWKLRESRNSRLHEVQLSNDDRVLIVSDYGQRLHFIDVTSHFEFSH